MTELTKPQLEAFAKLLKEKRDHLIEEAKRTLDNDMVVPSEERMDEVDQASSEYMQAFSFRLRGRERFLMGKIDKALRKIDDGEYGLCEECDEPISLKRLQARPEAQLCIQCKEAQEKEEAVYADD
ncbi:MAG: TraR/DksA family transcriptional regulator [Nannocystales bacterium]